MKTFNRNPANIDTGGIKNYSKYFNQMNFKGISEDDNIYAIDQETFRDANNVYVNSDNKLVSRPTLQKDSLPSEIDIYQYDLEDVKYIGQNTIYINKSKTGSNYYFILLVDKDNNKYSIENVTNYHISTIEHYIICWNNVGAKVFDTNESNKGWQDFNDFVEIPITKIVSGTTETIIDSNEFTKQYKEQYIYSNQSFPLLPTTQTKAEVEVFSKNSESLKYDIHYPYELTDYKIFKRLKAPDESSYNPISGYNSSADKYIIAIPEGDSVLISFNGGQSYKNILYPEHNRTTMPNGSITEDGLYYCFVANDGVYFLNLSTFIWTKDDLDMTMYKFISACFKTREIYSFVVQLVDSNNDGNILRIYFKGYSLYSGKDYTKDKTLSYIEQTYIDGEELGLETVNLNTLFNERYQLIKNDRVKIFETKNNLDEDILIILVCLTKEYNKDYLVTIIGGKNMWNSAYSTPGENEGMLVYTREVGDGGSNCSIVDGTISAPVGDDWVYGFTFNLIADAPTSSGAKYLHHWSTRHYEFKITTIVDGSDETIYRPIITTGLGIDEIPSIPSDYYELDQYYYYTTPQKLQQCYIYVNTNIDLVYILPYESDSWEMLSSLSVIIENPKLFVLNDKYFLIGGNPDTVNNRDRILVTNLLSDDDLAEITYTYGVKSNYTKVPSVSYSDTELYLGFGDLLQITKNTRATNDVTKINFNLPTRNNQSFIDDITAMVNISTTEIALFFLNKIVICSKVPDSNLSQGFRYDYYNTKFSLGVRLGDTVMNTLEGQYTIFPTKRGLAIMNYQTFMATTDQVIHYVTDNIRELWNKFYENNNLIKIIQWNNKLIFTNNTNIILLYDLDRSSWWKWEVPIMIKLPVTDYINLKLINTELNIFKDAAQYYDFSEIGNFREINWFLMSQPLHMSAPNYYKNMKQLVFQFSEGNDNIVTKTMNAQIKLYRKRLSIKEPETIKFQIENLRTFVKRFNYWKINEIQWALANDTDTNVPKKFELNAISIKYEIGDEVR